MPGNEFDPLLDASTLCCAIEFVPSCAPQPATTTSNASLMSQM
jgi:hypothetical protein